MRIANDSSAQEKVIEFLSVSSLAQSSFVLERLTERFIKIIVKKIIPSHFFFLHRLQSFSYIFESF